jgi:uncharacterized protein (DUF433 family)
MQLPDFLTEHAYGAIRLTGHRIGLEHVMYYYHQGCSPEMLVEQYPTLSLELVQKVIAFYEQNREEVDAYVADCESKAEQLRATTPSVIDWAELRRRFEAMRRQEKP